MKRSIEDILNIINASTINGRKPIILKPIRFDICGNPLEYREYVVEYVFNNVDAKNYKVNIYFKTYDNETLCVSSDDYGITWAFNEEDFK